MKKGTKAVISPRAEALQEFRRNIGRPTVFTPQVLERILDLIARDGMSERAAFRQLEAEDTRITWASWHYYKLWAEENDKNFFSHLARAKEMRCEILEDERMQIARDESRDILEWEEITESEKHGITVKRGKSSDNTAVQRDKLQD